MATENQIISYSESHNVIELPYGDSSAYMYLIGTRLSTLYNSVYHTVFDDVSSYVALKFTNGDDEYVILYTLRDMVLSRYIYKLTLYDYELEFELTISTTALSLSTHFVNDNQHSVSYIDTSGFIYYIAFDHGVGIKYYWDYSDTRTTNQIEFDNGDNIGIYFIDDDNVNTEEIGIAESYITLTPVVNVPRDVNFELDFTYAAIDTDSMDVSINDIQLDRDQWSLDGYLIRFNLYHAVIDQNTVKLYDDRHTYTAPFTVAGVVTLTPTFAVKDTTVLSLDITHAVINTDIMVIKINGVTLLDSQWTLDGNVITFNPHNKIDGDNIVELLDDTYLYTTNFNVPGNRKRIFYTIGNGQTNTTTATRRITYSSGRGPGVAITGFRDKS